eukprot:CAMPEP_0114549198 /NCGR_PEP_ID=MMETSP0114-20121206/5400_1 /TAXON_ID=31324 /ORGANISM="Goniomonas sp, Strain m" /LENGTH=260 /DNA_ID=CAMNT_0001733865 /DNA_START=39 /DNA_END=821 /DNA_ORIENTATION=+
MTSKLRVSKMNRASEDEVKAMEERLQELKEAMAREKVKRVEIIKKTEKTGFWRSSKDPKDRAPVKKVRPPAEPRAQAQPADAASRKQAQFVEQPPKPVSNRQGSRPSSSTSVRGETPEKSKEQSGSQQQQQRQLNTVDAQLARADELDRRLADMQTSIKNAAAASSPAARPAPPVVTESAVPESMETQTAGGGLPKRANAPKPAPGPQPKPSYLNMLKAQNLTKIDPRLASRPAGAGPPSRPISATSRPPSRPASATAKN